MHWDAADSTSLPRTASLAGHAGGLAVDLIGVAGNSRSAITRGLSRKDLNRPELEELIKFVREGDTVLVHSMDRLARNLDDLRSIVHRLTAKKVRVEFVKEQLSFTGDDNAMANLLLNVMGAFAEFERSLIRERQREGIALAKTRGVYRGRNRSLDEARAAELREKAAAGVPKAALARDFGISRETVYAYLRAKA